jgi:hypothetical protein
MRVKCNKIISRATKKDLGDKSPWLTKDKEYLVLAMSWSSKFGMDVCIQTEQYNEPAFIRLEGFEIVSQKIPSSWVTTTQQFGDQTLVYMLPKSWNYETFFEEIEDEKSEAVALFNKEVEQICREEGLID